jgi:hypothetical protein
MQVLNRRMGDQEDEAACVLVEEMGEVLQALGKIGRFGLYPTDSSAEPPRTYDNLTQLKSEQVDVLAAILLMQHMGLFYPADTDEENNALCQAVYDKCERIADRLQTIDSEAWLAFAREQLYD